MRTEYKFGLGRDRRELSYYQTADWCRYISTLRKKISDRRGESHNAAKLTNEDVLFIRSFITMPRKLAAALAVEFKIAVAYVYQLRKIENGQYKKWRHLIFQKPTLTAE